VSGNQGKKDCCEGKEGPVNKDWNLLNTGCEKAAWGVLKKTRGQLSVPMIGRGKNAISWKNTRGNKKTCLRGLKKDRCNPEVGIPVCAGTHPSGSAKDHKGYDEDLVRNRILCEERGMLKLDDLVSGGEKT